MSITYNGKTDLDGVPSELEITCSWTYPEAGDFSEVTKPFPPGFACELVTNPGAVAPTDNYDVSITDSDGTDVLKGVGANRDATASERAVPLEAGVPTPTAFSGALTFNVSGSAGNTTGVAKLLCRFFRR